MSTHRSCIIVLNLANLTGFLNNTELNRGKMRIDYGQLLATAANGRNIIGALCVSQCDPWVMSAKSEDSRKSNRKFLFSLQAFSWTPLEVDYNSRTQNMNTVVRPIYDSVCDMLLNPDGSHKYDLSLVDIVFITGTAKWSEVMTPFAENGFPIEVLYPKKSTSGVLYSQYAFRDLQPFILESNQRVMEKKLVALETKGRV